MDLKRRDTFKLAAGACMTTAAYLMGAGGRKKKGKKKRRGRIGIQLYCVRGLFSKDPEGTLRAIGAMGYQGVEFYGYGGGPAVFKGKGADEFRKILDASGLKCCGMHLRFDTLLGDKLDQTVEINKKLGNRFLIVASAQKQMSSPEAIAEYAETLNEIAAKLKPKGMRVGYHCHGHDFKKVDGKTAWDLLFSKTNRRVIMQLDMGNCAGGGGDPVAILKKFPGRAASVHVKDWPAARLTKDSEIWKTIFTLCREKHHTRWYVVEQGEREGNSLDIAKKTLATLRAMGL